MGSSDRPSQDAERDSGDEYDGTEGGGEELESSHRPDGSKKQQKDYGGCEGKKPRTNCQGAGRLQGVIISASKSSNSKQPATALTYNDSGLVPARLKQPLTDF